MTANPEAGWLHTSDQIAAMTSQERVAIINRYRQESMRGRYNLETLNTLDESERNLRTEELRDAVRLIKAERQTRSVPKAKKPEAAATALTDFL